MSPPDARSKLSFDGRILFVKARIRLIRSFDQVPTHQYQGYVLQLLGRMDTSELEFRVAVGPAAHKKLQFRIGDRLAGFGVPVPDPELEWADLYRVSGLELLERPSQGKDEVATAEGGIAPDLPTYRAHGHRRLDRETWEVQCMKCPWGLNMVTEIILDHWNPHKKKFRFETHCYGPRDCPQYNAGKPYRVPGRKQGMVYVDDDVERQAESKDC